MNKTTAEPKKSKEYIISIVLSCAALVCYAVCAITGLMSGTDFFIDKIFFHLGNAMLLFGCSFLMISQNNNNKKDE